jgi:hypothetical protein
MLRPFLAFLAAALLAIPTIRCRAGEVSIPQDPQRQEQRFREMLAWNSRTLGGAYEKVGKKDPRWDKYAREALDAAARNFSHVIDPQTYLWDIQRATQNAVALGCDDPLILYLHTDVRVSKCPQCNRPTYARKFPLLIHVEGFGPLVPGKTCRYCAKCELIVAHQDELEAQLAQGPTGLMPGAGGYLVIGTVDKKAWQKGLQGSKGQSAATLQMVADFKNPLTIQVDPGGWSPA